MNRIAKRFACLCLAVAMTVPAGALAQDVAAQPAPAEPVPATTAAPVGVEATSAPVETTVAPVEEAPAATEETEPAPEDASAPVAGWFRLDNDFGGLQLWAGATFPLSDTIGLATDIYVYGPYGEFDIGPSITLAPGISILPMIGLQIDWFNEYAQSFVPQLYAYVDTSSIYFEFWGQVFLTDMFHKGANDFIHLRAFPLYKINDWFAFGVEIDANINIANAPTKAPDPADPTAAPEEVTLLWLPIGPHLKMNAGASSTIELFVGYDVAAETFAAQPLGAPGGGEDRHLAGRFTFVQTF
jgi:hypothetical protein